MYIDELVDELEIDLTLQNIWIHRARQQLAETGLPGAGTIIERRAGTRQLRIGIAQLRIV
jgi:hypothetical protein